MITYPKQCAFIEKIKVTYPQVTVKDVPVLSVYAEEVRRQGR